jgi:hypothetical protein
MARMATIENTSCEEMEVRRRRENSALSVPERAEYKQTNKKRNLCVAVT